MIASVHIAEISRRAALGVLRKAPTAEKVPGLRYANTALAAPLSGSLLAAPQFGRAGLVAFWDDEASLDHFLAEHPTAQALADGWRVRLEPLRMHGSWPGVPDDLPRSRTVDHDGPAAVLTLGRLKFNRALAFLRTSAKAEGAVVNAPGMRWATGLAKPPFVCTCSLWESDEAVRAYAYSDAPPEHSNAITTDRAKGFHKQSAFIRFRPFGSEGKLDGRNPLSESWMAG